MALYFLNLPLDKSERLSNWHTRPLRDEMISYAALDAYALNELYTLIFERIQKIEDQDLVQNIINMGMFNLFPKNTDNNNKSSNVCENELEEMFVQNILKYWEEYELSSEIRKTRIDQVKLVVDSMLFGFGQKLRRLGFDTELIGHRQSLIEFCQKNPDYYALSTGKGFKQIHSHIGERAIHVKLNGPNNEALPASNLIMQLIQRLNIFNDSTVFKPRCVKCNRRDFWKISRHLVRLMFNFLVYDNNFDWIPIDQFAFKEAELHSNPSFYVNDDGTHNGDEYFLCSDTLTAVCHGFSVDIR